MSCPAVELLDNQGGGDGENRTRVRKIRPPKLYERRRSRFVIAEVSSG